MQHLISANIHFLDQAERLLIQVSDGDYCEPVKTFYGSTLGQHLRHCLDHYSSLINGLPDAKIDYDHRQREADLECSTETAVARVSRIRQTLLDLEKADLPVGLLVKMDCGSFEGTESEWQPSTLGRELQFLVSHTVHHFAMIGGMCTCLGVAMEEGFGVAPSTLRHREMVSID